MREEGVCGQGAGCRAVGIIENVFSGAAECVPWRKIPDWIVIDQPNMEKAKPSDMK